MKYPNLHDLSKRAAALVLTAALLVPSAFASAGTTRLSTSRTLADGLTYINTISEHPSSGRIESFSFQLEPGSDVTPIMVQSSGTIYGAATINKAVSYAESLGYHVVGGINSDFSLWAAASPTASPSRRGYTSPARRETMPSPWWTAVWSCPPPHRWNSP